MVVFPRFMRLLHHKDGGRLRQVAVEFGWIALGTLVVLSVVLIVPAVSRLFSFVTPTPFLLCLALGMVAVSLLWFEGVKWGFRVRSRHAARYAARSEATASA